MDTTIDSAQLNFDTNSLWVLNICLAIVMFGVALGLKGSNFLNILKSPRPAIIGIISQFILLPALTFLLVYIMQPQPSIALGMIMVAACPGGNVSNFMSQISGANSALSVSLTAFSTVLAIFFTPFNFQFWGSLYGPTHGLLRQVSLNPLDIFHTVALILGLPLVAGILVNTFRPALASRMAKILKPLSIGIFAVFVLVAFTNNMELFTSYIHLVILVVFLHNGLALGCGYYFARITGLGQADQRTIAIETGIQNSGLGLLLIFTFFDGLGGMAIVAGWWGIWHILSGFGLAYLWSRKKYAQLAK